MTTKRKIINVIIALLIIAVGVVLIGNATSLWDINVLFKGWWAAALMIMFLIFIINDSPNVFNVGGLIVFGVILLKKTNVIPEKVNIWLIIVAAVLIVIGLRLIFPGKARQLNIMTGKFESTTESDSDGKIENDTTPPESGNVSVTFRSENCSYAGRNYCGGTFNASFGELCVDLRGATINESYNTRLSAAFGKITLLVDPSVRIELNKSAVFGSVMNYVPVNNAGTSTLHINADSAFGEVAIRCN